MGEQIDLIAQYPKAWYIIPVEFKLTQYKYGWYQTSKKICVLLRQSRLKVVFTKGISDFSLIETDEFVEKFPKLCCKYWQHKRKD